MTAPRLTPGDVFRLLQPETLSLVYFEPLRISRRSWYGDGLPAVTDPAILGASWRVVRAHMTAGSYGHGDHDRFGGHWAVEAKRVDGPEELSFGQDAEGSIVQFIRSSQIELVGPMVAECEPKR